MNRINKKFYNSKAAFMAVFVTSLSLTSITSYCSEVHEKMPELKFQSMFVLPAEISEDVKLNQVLAASSEELNKVWNELPTIKTRKGLKATLKPIFDEMHKQTKSISPTQENSLWIAETEARIAFADVHRALRAGLKIKYFKECIAQLSQPTKYVNR
jgi:hypothetical protein